ncbi:M14 family zinc carboxypeptidase [Kamptonema cortianum]|nr:M14 family zinc carboxypeptidase [Geitlerinema splendidum]MDK3156058.1 M14 family zinc carboxypeptidase [Kamptonema cortianum]
MPRKLLRAILFFVAFSITSFALAENYTLVKVHVRNAFDYQRLINSDLDTAECVNHLGSNDVLVGAGDWPKLWNLGLRYTLAGVVDASLPARGQEATDYRNEYFNADEIIAFYEGLRAQDPAFVSRKEIGRSINNEPIWAYKIGHPTNAKNANNIIVIGLIHAREWITGSVVMHMAKKSLETVKDPTISRDFANKNIHFVPIVNPDGYRYTWTNSRLWRKNRRQVTSTVYGVDLNRNFSKDWGNPAGSSGNPSSQTYRGTAPFSEPETRALRDYMLSLPRVGGFCDVHSYSQLVLLPWGHTSAPTQDSALFEVVGDEMKTAMSAFGATYRAGVGAVILYIASGISDDYVYDQYRAIAIGLEMRDTGEFGFLLPPSQISVSQDEGWAGLRALVNRVPN